MRAIVFAPLLLLCLPAHGSPDSEPRYPLVYRAGVQVDIRSSQWPKGDQLTQDQNQLRERALADILTENQAPDRYKLERTHQTHVSGVGN